MFLCSPKTLFFWIFCATILIPPKTVKIVYCFSKNRRVIFINIEIKKQNKLKDFFRRRYNRLEDLLFSIIQKLPDKFISNFLINWLDRYTTKRISQLKQEQVRNTWRSIYLKKAAKEIRGKQKAPYED